MTTAKLMERDPTAFYDVFITHYELVDRVVRENLALDHQTELAPLIIVGVFRRFFQLAPLLLGDNFDDIIPVLLTRIAEDGARRYSDNAPWMKEVQEQLSSLKSRRVVTATVATALRSALKRYAGMDEAGVMRQPKLAN